MHQHNDYLDEAMRTEGRGKKALDPICRGCWLTEGTVRCEDCFGGELWCRQCTVTRHALLPLHIVKEWNGHFFKPISLRDLGLRVQLGEDHEPGSTCMFGKEIYKEFVVLHTNGIHHVSVDYCGCTPTVDIPKVPIWTQLIRVGWYPATTIDPQTCATFDLMKSFHLLSLQGKISHYHYYKALHYRTENSGILHVPDRYAAFCLLARKWRHEKMLKRAGRAYDPRADRVEATGQGELAVNCRACPMPGWNLPEGWENASEADRPLYTLIICIDTCFRLKNKLRSNDAKSPTLGPGWAYMVNHAPYLEHVKQYTNQEELSTCSGFAAIHLANLKGMRGHRTSGVGGICCARHDCWRPNGLGDLQVGERRYNIDFILACSIMYISAFMSLILSYDIACQYLKNFWTHMRDPKFPSALTPKTHPNNLSGKIPKFHFDAHGKKDHAQYSFHYTKGVGKVDGEGIERNWSEIKPAAAQTIEMGPGARRDVIDDFCAYGNYRKQVAFVVSLLKKMIKAVPDAVIHRRAFEEFDSYLRRDKADQVEKWEGEYAAWDEQSTGSPCLFDSTEPTITMARVQLELSNEEAARVGFSNTAAHTQSSFIMLALDIEDAQQRLHLDVKEQHHPTQLQRAAFQDRRVVMRKHIIMLRKLQDVYMPGLRNVLPMPEVLDDGIDTLAEDTALYLPSDFIPSERARCCVVAVSSVEERLREAGSHKALHELRRTLFTRTYLNKWRVKNISGQHMSTRARSLQHTVQMRVLDAKVRYRCARKALRALRGPGPWEDFLQELKDDDVRVLNERLLTDQEKAEHEHRVSINTEQSDDVREGVVITGTLGEGKKTLSWISTSVPAGEDTPEMIADIVCAALKVEWAKCKARAARAHEDLRHVEEDMRRVLAYGVKREAWWNSLPRNRPNVDPELAEGLAAYAAEHADLEVAYRTKAEGKWLDTRRRVQLVLADLARSGFPETYIKDGEAVIVDMGDELAAEEMYSGEQDEHPEEEDDNGLIGGDSN
ncbi:hypothetical protein FIBSPDRAFT_979972 [Athelia psychrophila]|uniref:CxC2-like cysteine cluster KDZ transposase-associated domain-containing protein n=1 Tax=Athelia psychrophila TaxID=1759441 RepID=A0A166DE81_9AGAM|nr:hypothetical protein FIBSPDRAFT_979972 [Fibularhizoctonia sp. CBS 109695]